MINSNPCHSENWRKFAVSGGFLHSELTYFDSAIMQKILSYDAGFSGARFGVK